MAQARTLVLALVLLAPSAIAQHETEPLQGPSGAASAWGLAWGRWAHSPGAPRGADLACPLGDVDGDGHADLLLHARDEAGDPVFRALAGPRFDRELWERAGDDLARLECAPDLAGDGIADAVVTIPTATSPATRSPLPLLALDLVAGRRPTGLAALDGATGAPLLELGSRSDARLAPAGPGLLLHVASETTAARVGLASASVTVARGATTIDILSAAGARVGRIEPPDPSAEILAYASVADAAGARILVLSAVRASPVEEAARQTPTVGAYDARGSLLWSLTLPETGGIPVLLPRAGDLDADGVVDLVVETLPQGLAQRGGGFRVLSGADGASLVEDEVDEGLAAALPFGPVRGATPTLGSAILVARQPRADAAVLLEQVVDGKVAWATQVSPYGVPVNALLDPFTGDLVGFSDLTGDGVADLALRIADAGRLDVLDGLGGGLLWSALLPDDAQVVPVPDDDGTSDLLVVDQDDESLDLHRLDGRTGAPEWSATGPAPDGDDDVRVSTEPITGDGTDDVLLTTDDEVYLIDGATGATQWTSHVVDGRTPPSPLEPRGEPTTAPRDASPTTGLAAIGVLASLAAGGALALWRRRAAR